MWFLRGTVTGTNRAISARPAPDRPQRAWAGTSIEPVCAGPYRVSNGLCRCLTFYIDRHSRLETRYGPAETGSRLVPVWAGWCRCRGETARNAVIQTFNLINNSLRNGESLKLGDLFGNRFKIVIRECDETDNNLIKTGIESLKNDGFVNYFGLQRFGNCAEIPTHSIGK